MELLLHKGIYCWRNNSTGIYDQKRKSFRTKSKYDINGVSDICGVLPDGKALFIEVKTKKGKLSPAQKKFLQMVKDLGGIAFKADCLKDVKDELSQYF